MRVPVQAEIEVRNAATFLHCRRLRANNPRPPRANRPRCTRCHALASPSRAEYWHIGEIMIRLRIVVPRVVSGLNRCGGPIVSLGSLLAYP